uniref:NUBPL iron-transfer P-loop NTPase n=1 Tax=Candidatus Kentrum sp. TC TaxID=2126339 RepID=A0A450YQJ8_9GAMM|nr:MAG: NUBPL iron-transfer P-loop NTPase [Candidatus Kentron sp. TC]
MSNNSEKYPPRIGFWSLKGGVGRSTLLAWSAVWLATQGKKVLTIDMDIEAPSLDVLFGFNVKEGAEGIYVGLWPVKGTRNPYLKKIENFKDKEGKELLRDICESWKSWNERSSSDYWDALPTRVRQFHGGQLEYENSGKLQEYFIASSTLIKKAGGQLYCFPLARREEKLTAINYGDSRIASEFDMIIGQLVDHTKANVVLLDMHTATSDAAAIVLGHLDLLCHVTLYKPQHATAWPMQIDWIRNGRWQFPSTVFLNKFGSPASDKSLWDLELMDLSRETNQRIGERLQVYTMPKAPLLDETELALPAGSLRERLQIKGWWKQLGDNLKGLDEQMRGMSGKDARTRLSNGLGLSGISRGIR